MGIMFSKDGPGDGENKPDEQEDVDEEEKGKEAQPSVSLVEKMSSLKVVVKEGGIIAAETGESSIGEAEDMIDGVDEDDDTEYEDCEDDFDQPSTSDGRGQSRRRKISFKRRVAINLHHYELAKRQNKPSLLVGEKVEEVVGLLRRPESERYKEPARITSDQVRSAIDEFKQKDGWKEKLRDIPDMTESAPHPRGCGETCGINCVDPCFCEMNDLYCVAKHGCKCNGHTCSNRKMPRDKVRILRKIEEANKKWDQLPFSEISTVRSVSSHDSIVKPVESVEKEPESIDRNGISERTDVDRDLSNSSIENVADTVDLRDIEADEDINIADTTPVVLEHISTADVTIEYISPIQNDEKMDDDHVESTADLKLVQKAGPEFSKVSESSEADMMDDDETMVDDEDKEKESEFEGDKMDESDIAKECIASNKLENDVRIDDETCHDQAQVVPMSPSNLPPSVGLAGKAECEIASSTVVNVDSKCLDESTEAVIIEESGSSEESTSEDQDSSTSNGNDDSLKDQSKDGDENTVALSSYDDDVDGRVIANIVQGLVDKVEVAQKSADDRDVQTTSEGRKKRKPVEELMNDAKRIKEFGEEFREPVILVINQNVPIVIEIPELETEDNVTEEVVERIETEQFAEVDETGSERNEASNVAADLEVETREVDEMAAIAGVIDRAVQRVVEEAVESEASVGLNVMGVEGIEEIDRINADSEAGRDANVEMGANEGVINQNVEGPVEEVERPPEPEPLNEFNEIGAEGIVERNVIDPDLGLEREENDQMADFEEDFVPVAEPVQVEEIVVDQVENVDRAEAEDEDGGAGPDVVEIDDVEMEEEEDARVIGQIMEEMVERVEEGENVVVLRRSTRRKRPIERFSYESGWIRKRVKYSTLIPNPTPKHRRPRRVSPPPPPVVVVPRALPHSVRLLAPLQLPPIQPPVISINGDLALLQDEMADMRTRLETFNYGIEKLDLVLKLRRAGTTMARLSKKDNVTADELEKLRKTVSRIADLM